MFTKYLKCTLVYVILLLCTNQEYCVQRLEREKNKMEKERKKILDSLVKMVKKEGEYIVASNSFSVDDVKYFNDLNIKVSKVNLVRPGLLGDYEVEYVGTKLEMGLN